MFEGNEQQATQETIVPNQSGNVDEQATGEVQPNEDSVQEETPKKYRLNIYGEEQEYDEQEVLTYAQKAAAADKRFQEASEILKKVETDKQELEAFKKDPWGTLKALGLNDSTIAEQAALILEEQLRLEGMSDEEKRALQLEKENKEYKEKLEKQQRLEAEQRQKALNEQAIKEVDNEIFQSLSSFKRKATPFLVYRIAEQLEAHLKATGGQEKLDTKAAIERSDKFFKGEIKEFYESTPVEEIVASMPPSLVKALKKHWMDQSIKSSPIGETYTRPPKQTSQQQKRPGSVDEWFKQREKQLMGE